MQDREKQFKLLLEHLKKYRGGEVVFIPNPGNAGDLLIAYACIQMIEYLGIIYRLGRFNESFTDEILLYGGGGNLIGEYPNCKQFLEENMTRNEITLFPCTIKDEDEIVSKFNEKITVFCRENISYEYVKKLHQKPANVYTAPDASLWIQSTAFFKSKKRKGLGTLFRTDNEKKSDIHIRNTNNLDISLLLMQELQYITREIIQDVSLKLLDFVSNFEKVKTDRLHIAIACHLTQTPCELYTNSYWKNEVVYKQSLSTSDYIQFIK